MVIAGFLASAAVFVLIGFAIGHAAGTVPVEYLGLLGLVPITLGIVGLRRLFGHVPALAELKQERTRKGATVFVATAGTQLGNGTDSIITMAALFADSNPAADMLIIGTIAATISLFVFIGNYSVRHRAFAEWIDRYGHRVTPFILIIVGVYIFANTATDILAD